MSIRTVDGQWVIAESGVATDDNCCCPPCLCPDECVDGLFISMEGDPTCYVAGSDVIYEDNITLPGGLLASVVMQCQDGEWTATLFICGVSCFSQYELPVPSGDDCLPVAGELTGWEAVAGGTCGAVDLPAVTILR